MHGPKFYWKHEWILHGLGMQIGVLERSLLLISTAAHNWGSIIFKPSVKQKVQIVVYMHNIGDA